MPKEEKSLEQKIDRLCAAVETCQERISGIEAVLQTIQRSQSETDKRIDTATETIRRELALLDESARLLLLQSVMNGMTGIDSNDAKEPEKVVNPPSKKPKPWKKNLDLCFVRVRQRDIPFYLQNYFNGLNPSMVTLVGNVVARKGGFSDGEMLKEGWVVASLRNDSGTICEIKAPKAGRVFFLNKESTFAVVENDIIAVIANPNAKQEDIIEQTVAVLKREHKTYG